uniref:Abhydrolase domain containing 14A n=1 Tax=Propithecus coquereli TaxID=379532 RepID=A0A2K6EZK3_PROCO
MVGALFGCWFRVGGARPVGPTMVQTSMSRSQVALLGLSLLLMLLLYVGLPGLPEQTSWLWGNPNVTVLAGLTPGNSPIFYREVLPLHQPRRPQLSSCMESWTASWLKNLCGSSATCPTTPW